MDRRTLETAAAKYSYLRGLLFIPGGLLVIVAALGNAAIGPFRHDWVFVLAVAAARRRRACSINRYYNENYGRLQPVVAPAGARHDRSSSSRSRSWSAGRMLARLRSTCPSTPIAVPFAIVMLISYAVGVGLKHAPRDHLGRAAAWRARCRSGPATTRATPGCWLVGRRGDGVRRVRPPPVRPHVRPARASPARCRSLRTAPVLDRLIHEPGRLAILTVLSSVTDADFVFLQRATGLTKGNLSSHLTKLEEAGLVTIEKRFIRKKPNTNVALTAVGRQRIAEHWAQLERLRRALRARPSAAAARTRCRARRGPAPRTRGTRAGRRRSCSRSRRRARCTSA